MLLQLGTARWRQESKLIATMQADECGKEKQLLDYSEAKRKQEGNCSYNEVQ